MVFRSRRGDHLFSDMRRDISSRDAHRPRLTLRPTCRVERERFCGMNRLSRCVEPAIFFGRAVQERSSERSLDRLRSGRGVANPIGSVKPIRLLDCSLLKTARNFTLARSCLYPSRALRLLDVHRSCLPLISERGRRLLLIYNVWYPLRRRLKLINRCPSRPGFLWQSYNPK